MSDEIDFESSKVATNSSTPGSYIQFDESQGNTAAPKNAVRLSADKEADLDSLIQRRIDEALTKERERYDEKIASSEKRFGDNVSNQQERFVGVASIFTALLAFVAAETALLKGAPANAFSSVSLILLGGLMLFATLIIRYTTKSTDEVTTKLRKASVAVVMIGILLSGWSARELIDIVADWIHSFLNFL